MREILLAALLVCIVRPAGAADTIRKETLTSGDRQRTYYLLVPDNTQGKPAPLIVLLHGSGRNGRIMVEYWQALARKEGVILAGPDSLNTQEWNMRPDGPQFLHDLIEALEATYPIDPRRIYVFGHSAGAIHALSMAILESEYFAGVAVSAGVLMQDYADFVDRAPRKTPIAIWVGTNDAQFPVAAVRATRDALNSHGFAVELTEIKGHTHRYYDRADEINQAAWAFLQKQHLTSEPKYQVYGISDK